MFRFIAPLAVLFFLSISTSDAFGSVFDVASGIGLGVDLRSVQKNKEALQQMKEESFYNAQSELLEALVHSPFDPALRMNLGLAYLAQEKYEEAKNEFDFVLEQMGLELWDLELHKRLSKRLSGKAEELGFYAAFNSAIAATMLENLREALRKYQLALGIRPDSIEVKTNIELLMQNLSGDGEGDGESDEDGEGGEGDEGDPDDNNGGGDPIGGRDHEPEYQGQNLSQDDVRRIFDELQGHDQRLRALEFSDDDVPSSEPGKDW